LVTPKSVPPNSQPTTKRTGFVAGQSKLTSRTQKSDIYANPDGTMTQRLYQQDENVPDGKGGYTTAQGTADGFAPAATEIGAHLPSALSAGREATFAAPSGPSVSFGLSGFGSGKGSASDSDVSYDLGGGQTLKYTFLVTGVEEQIVLASAPKSASWAFPLQTNGLTPTQGEDGSISLAGKDGAVELVIPAPQMWDSNIDPLSGDAVEGPASQTLSKAADGSWTLSISADQKWLADPARVWPVTVDPTTMEANNAYSSDSFVSSAYPTANYNVNYESDSGAFTDHVGYFDGTTGTNWTFLNYDISTVLGKHIITATWHGGWIHSYYPSTPTTYLLNPVDGPWDASTITWNNKPPVGGPGSVLGSAYQGEWTTSDVTTMVANAAAGTPWYSLELDANDEGTTSWKKLAAGENGISYASYIDISYNTTPVVLWIDPPGPAQRIAEGHEYDASAAELGQPAADAAEERALPRQIMTGLDVEPLPAPHAHGSRERIAGCWRQAAGPAGRCIAGLL
jgi:hypothetical protein